MQIECTPAQGADREFVAHALADAGYQRHYAGATSIAGMREGTAAIAAHEFVRQLHPEVRVTPLRIAGIGCEALTLPNGDPRRTLLYVHGGGFVRGSLDMARGNASWLAAAAGVRVLAVGYRQAPEHPFPAAPQDVLAVYEALLAEAGAPQALAVVGESSGGTLALGLAAWLEARATPLPAAIAALSPMADLELRGASWQYNAAKDVADRATGCRAVQAYLGPASPRDALASPMSHHFHACCPLLLSIGSHETMLSDTERLAFQADAAGVEVTLKVYEDMPHGFTRFKTAIGTQALNDAAQWLVRRLQRPAG